MTNDDVIYRSRLCLFALAKRWAACEQPAGCSASTTRLITAGDACYFDTAPELLRPRERRQPRMPNAISPMVEQRILAMAIAFPGWGSNRISLELGRPK